MFVCDLCMCTPPAGEIAMIVGSIDPHRPPAFSSTVRLPDVHGAQCGKCSMDSNKPQVRSIKLWNTTHVVPIKSHPMPFSLWFMKLGTSLLGMVYSTI